MGLLVGLVQQIRNWDRPSQIALGTALVLLLVTLVVLATVPPLQTPALIGTVGLVIALQVIVLWGNRGLVTPYTKAQRHFIAGEFARARDMLKAHIAEQEAAGKLPGIDALVLLGNAYRNLGQLRESESVLRVALARKPDYHFALYGVGKIRLAMGDYAEATKHFEKALRNGAPPTVRFDLAHAVLRSGDLERTLSYWESAANDEQEDPHKQLFAQFVLHDVQGADVPSADLMETGLPFWEAEAERFSDTPYGEAIRGDVQAMRNLSLKT